MNNELLIFIPTYNESGNVIDLYHALKQYAPQAHILFLDDNSPDGTGALLDKLAEHDVLTKVIHRSGKLGIGSAHLQAFAYARNYNYRYLLTMDADFTHDPRFIPDVLAQKDKADVIIGSRHVQGGKLEGWPLYRQVVTHSAYAATTLLLGLKYDCTGAYRLYNVARLQPNLCDRIQSNGYSFFIESLYQLKKSGACIVEVPITALIRDRGISKISKREIIKAVIKIVALTKDRLLTKTRIVAIHGQK